MNIVIPMAGAGSRFVKAGYKDPKPFIDIDGKTMIERVLDNLQYPNARYILIARKEHLESRLDLASEIKKKYNVEFITVDKDGYITLTDAGREIAEKIYERHTLLTNFLTGLGVDEETAADDACKMEHDISDTVFEAIKNHVAGR